MGFGSYDETEQENNEVEIENNSEEVENIERNEGEIEFEEMDADTMLDQFKEIN